MSTPPLIVVMGVSGAGKSTVGAVLAQALGVPFADADNLHPAANVAKMAAGQPLTDGDRAPWLALVGEALADASGTGLVMACSALKRSYREAIRARAASVVFVHLEGSRDLLGTRLGARSGHFMPAALLDSQLAILEPLEADEPGITVGIDGTTEQTVRQIAGSLFN